MQIGEEYRVTLDSTPDILGGKKARKKGKIVYIHPQGRFATLEFEGVHGSFRECFYPEQLMESNRVWERSGRYGI